MIVAVQHLTKRFGSVLAVDDLSFDVPPGRVTGFLGPNGAGKTTTLRMLLGLVTPTSGTATIGGIRYPELPEPQRAVGAVLESSDFHPGRTARNHLRVQASTARVGDARVDEVLGLVGLSEAAGRRVGGFSLGMRQRLGLAGALLADPAVLLLDEPANGLDPEGIAWLRAFLRGQAAQGRTVLVSSHVLSEVEQTVDDVVIISGGRLVRRAPLAELADRGPVVVARTPTAGALLGALAAAGLSARQVDEHTVEVTGVAPEQVGHLAFTAGVELHGLAAQADDLEQIFLRLVDGAQHPGAPVPPDRGRTRRAPGGSR
jgi:ABC-2 type transport system ATP-binding protein